MKKAKEKKIKTYVLMVSKKFLSCHVNSGEPTHFVEYIKTKIKIHTLRLNYDYWNKIVSYILNGDAILSLRVWDGLPYKSKQVEFLQLDKNSGIGIEKMFLDLNSCTEIAKNDGLSLTDFKDWFKEHNITEPIAVIHFTNFRYSNNACRCKHCLNYMTIEYTGAKRIISPETRDMPADIESYQKCTVCEYSTLPTYG